MIECREEKGERAKHAEADGRPTIKQQAPKRHDTGIRNAEFLNSIALQCNEISEKIYLYQALVKVAFTFTTPVVKAKAKALPLPPLPVKVVKVKVVKVVW